MGWAAVRVGTSVAVLAFVVAAAVAEAAPRESAAAWAERFLARRSVLVEEAPCRGTTPLLERYEGWLAAAGCPGDGGTAAAAGTPGAGLGIQDASVAMMRLAMTVGIERLEADWTEGGDWPAADAAPAYGLGTLGRRVDPLRVRRFAAGLLGLRRVLVPVHGADMGVRARLAILSLLRQVLVADARAGLLPDPLTGPGGRDVMGLLDSVLVGFSSDDDFRRGLPPDLCRAGMERLAWFDGIFPLVPRRVARMPSALSELARALSSRAAEGDRLTHDELARFDELARSAVPPPEVFALPPRERLARLEAWRPHLNARTRQGEVFPPASGEGSPDRPRALLGSLLAGLDLTDDCARELQLRAQVRALAVAWGVAEFWQSHRRAAASWDELAPLVPPGLRVDPINAGLLRFDAETGGAVAVWSDGFRETPGGWSGDLGCVALAPRYGFGWRGLLR